MKKLLLFFIFLLVISSGFKSDAHADPVKFGLDSSHSLPLLYQFENQNMGIATGGLMYEMSVAIGEELHDDYSITTFPGPRLAFEVLNGNIDLTCNNSPKWSGGLSDEAQWSKTIYTNSVILVGKKEIPFDRADHLMNTKIGTVENYLYGDLEDKFKSKILQRVDAVTVVANLNKLLDNKLDYIVMSEVEYNFYKETYPVLQRSSFAVDKTDIQCALSRKSSLTLKKLNETIDRLAKKQVFQQIYKRYINPKTNFKPIVYGLNDTNSPPFLIYDNNTEYPTIQGGLFFDIGLEMGRKLKRPVKFLLSPRKRLDSGLADGKIELVCYNTEAWAGEFAKDYYWSIPIFKQSNYVVSNSKYKGNADLKTIKDLKGKTVGTTLGFVYPNLTPYFKDGSLIREDVLSGTANLSKLNAARIPFILLNNLEYNYYKKKYPDLQRAPFEIDPLEVKCAISKKSNLKLKELNAAIRDLKKSGRMQEIFLPH
ncbi:transporter substrate-binding domain-containing protein [Bacteriovorax sp. PP10]|uniref:Transporter substrate-binding domain-containing protein n=1 Tax=Bacteriovorax antarcticus TaxID=3088717 RepID=A0ABU5VZB2_9BACT|nr:transporter substrate-binding domain-containing protein [Bacteriovorax sp. PP10]MEA9358336.1 transporter substrate-binding domain-containing protein [Bacteriovorax sp. PP10]